MAAPLIIITQSVLEFLQNQSWEFQPYATNTPTAWNCSPLPPGMSFDTSTGRIHGASTKPGVYTFGLMAINADGPSPIETFVCGIEASTLLPSIDSIDVAIDLDLLMAGVSKAATIKATRGQGKNAKEVTPLFWLKSGDVKVFHIRFFKGGVVSDVSLETLKLSLKAFEPEASVVTASTFVRCDTGANTFYRLFVTVSSAALTGELGNQERAFATQIAGLGEFEWTWQNNLIPTVAGAPATLRSSSLNFDVGLEREQIKNS